MAGYGYTNDDWNRRSNGNGGYTNRGVDDWNRRSNGGYTNGGGYSSDNYYRRSSSDNAAYPGPQVIVDAEGRRRPIVSYPSNQYSSESYAPTDRWRSPSSTPNYENFTNRAETEASRIARTGFMNAPNSGTAAGYGTGAGALSGLQGEILKDAVGMIMKDGGGKSNSLSAGSNNGLKDEIMKEAVELVKDAAMSSSLGGTGAPPRFNLPSSMSLRRDAEDAGRGGAARRYGSFNLPSRR